MVDGVQGSTVTGIAVMAGALMRGGPMRWTPLSWSWIIDGRGRGRLTSLHQDRWFKTNLAIMAQSEQGIRTSSYLFASGRVYMCSMGYVWSMVAAGVAGVWGGMEGISDASASGCSLLALSDFSVFRACFRERRRQR